MKIRSFWQPKHFLRKTLKISAPNSFFQNQPKFFYLILNLFNKFLIAWNWTIWRKRRGDWGFETWIWRKASSFRVGRGGCLSRESSLGSEFLRKRWRWAYFLWYASGPGIPPTLDLEEGEALYDKRNKMVRQPPFWQRYGVVSQHFYQSNVGQHLLTTVE